MPARTEYYDDPAAPEANSLVPASNLLVEDDTGAILLQRRRDTGQWALPGGKQDIGESAAACAIRECLEETGIVAEITGLLGVYSNPAHIVAYSSNGEIRQQFEVAYIGRPPAVPPRSTTRPTACAGSTPATWTTTTSTRACASRSATTSAASTPTWAEPPLRRRALLCEPPRRVSQPRHAG